MSKYYIEKKEIMEALDVSDSKALAIIRELNDQLKEKGYVTVAAKVSRKYFEEKYYGYGDMCQEGECENESTANNH